MKNETVISQGSDSTDLKSALAKYQIELDDRQFEFLDAYRALLWETNARLNLTRHTTFDKFVSRDLVDSLELSKWLHADEDVLDVGSGGGVPGIVLSILRPDIRISLCESVGKKSEALAGMVAELGLPIPIYAARAEHILVDFRFDATVARAVGPLWKMCYWFQDCWPAVGRLLAIKGPGWIEERGEARHRGLMHGLDLRKIASYPMPDTEAESVILKIWPKGTLEK